MSSGGKVVIRTTIEIISLPSGDLFSSLNEHNGWTNRACDLRYCKAIGNFKRYTWPLHGAGIGTNVEWNEPLRFTNVVPSVGI